MHAVSLIHLIISVVIAIVLLVIGIMGIVKKDQVYQPSAQDKVLIGGAMIGLGALLLLFSVLSYSHQCDEYY